MAFNWDKLLKVQGDYPKPKFALDAVNKLLKKRPGDPYLTVWKADVSLQLNVQAQEVTQLLTPLCQRQPPLTDSRLLSYLYEQLVYAARRASSKPVGSVGSEGIKAYQNAAKSFQSKEDRLNSWSDLFVMAMREDCWEDVRMAIVQANKEGPNSKKIAYYSLVLANQLAAERKQAAAEEGAVVDPMTRILFESAYRQMKQAYEKPPDDLVQVKDMRDLRFMAEIFRRQNRCAELIELLDNAPPPVQDLVNKYKSDIMLLKVQILREKREWKLLEDLGFHTIEGALEEAENGNSEQLEELSSRSWTLWEGLLQAIDELQSGNDKLEKVEERWRCCFQSKPPKRAREVALTELALSQYFKRPLLPLCQDYWKTRSSLNCCFDDLRRYIERLSEEDRKEFYSSIGNSQVPVPDGEKATEARVDKWLQSEVNALKFRYLLMISLPRLPTQEAIETFVCDSLQLYQTGLKSGGSCHCDAGYLAVIGLLRLHHWITQGGCKEEGVARKRSPNSRLLLQATMLARHLIASETGKQNRTLVLLSTRLHLNLGLGTIAFRQYGDTKVKEMLKDTVAPIVLSRISQTQPFEEKGHHGFSAKDELASACLALEKMEKRTGDLLYVDMKSFLYDQALELLDFKKRLHFSLTKHLCAIESQRIARLRGESTGMAFDDDMKAPLNFTDSIDLTVFPSFEASGSNVTELIIPVTIPSTEWLNEYIATAERATKLLFKETTIKENEKSSTKLNHSRWICSPDLADQSAIDATIPQNWTNVLAITLAIKDPNAADWEKSDKQYFFDLLSELSERRKGLEMLILPTDQTGLKPEDERPMFHENMLMLLYGNLELVRAHYRLTELIKETVLTKKGSHPLSKKIPKGDVDTISAETEACYNLIHRITKSYIDHLKRRGQVAIRAQVRSGPTGGALKEVLVDDDLEFYATGMVNSAVEAFSGVLKVKLR